jgi:glycosyltransferase involved in cell wall biosynthesis
VEQGCSPLKILESMAAGVPVIASRLDAIEEIISNSDLGLLVQAQRPEELARAIRICYEYPKLRDDISIKAKQHIENNFSWQKNKNLSCGVFSNVLKITNE